MALLGLLSLVQVGFLPGILIALCIPRLERQDRLLLALPLSCVANYFLVIGLTFAGFYTQGALLAVTALEVVAIAAILRRKGAENSTGPLLDLSPLIPRGASKPGVIRILFVLVLLTCLLQTLKQIGTVFVDGDAILHWNTWAIEWFNGQFPTHTHHYPQLLPALYSMTYRFMGTAEVQFFAKFVAAFFPLMALAVYVRLAGLLEDQGPAILLAAVLLVFIFIRTMGSGFWFTGYADFPLAYFSLVLCYVFCLLLRRAREPGAAVTDPLFLWCAVLAGGAVLLKHSAGYLAAVLPCAWYYYIGRRETDTRAVMMRMALACAIIAVIVGHWYVYKQLQIAAGTETSNLGELATMVDLPWYAKLFRAVDILSRKISWLWLVLFGFGLTHALGRALALWIFLPFFVLWALFVSYDYRNLSLGLPALSVILAFGALRIHELVTTSPGTARYARSAVYLALSVIAVAAAVKLTSKDISEKLVQDSLRAQRRMENPEVNELLYAHFRYRPEPGKVASTYYPVGYLPGMQERYFRAECDGLVSAARVPGVRYIMVSDWCPQDVRQSLEAGARAGRYKMLFAHGEQVFYEIMPGAGRATTGEGRDGERQP